MLLIITTTKMKHTMEEGARTHCQLLAKDTAIEKNMVLRLHFTLMGKEEDVLEEAANHDEDHKEWWREGAAMDS